jgi:hypothetical protein
MVKHFYVLVNDPTDGAMLSYMHAKVNKHFLAAPLKIVPRALLGVATYCSPEATENAERMKEWLLAQVGESGWKVKHTQDLKMSVLRQIFGDKPMSRSFCVEFDKSEHAVLFKLKFA